MSLNKLMIVASLALAAHGAAIAQSLPTAGTLVVVPANGEVTIANDQAIATFAVEEQDKDKAAAASRVNQKMKQGMEIIRKEDPQAALKTQGYYTYPVYPEERPLPNGVAPKVRVPTAYRVGQYLEVKTTNLAALPKTTAAAQKILSLNGLQFGLTPATTKRVDDQRIAAAYQNLGERVAAIEPRWAARCPTPCSTRSTSKARGTTPSRSARRWPARACSRARPTTSKWPNRASSLAKRRCRPTSSER
jgi:uncharacterized protein YggE